MDREQEFEAMRTRMKKQKHGVQVVAARKRAAKSAGMSKERYQRRAAVVKAAKEAARLDAEAWERVQELLREHDQRRAEVLAARGKVGTVLGDGRPWEKLGRLGMSRSVFVGPWAGLREERQDARLGTEA